MGPGPLLKESPSSSVYTRFTVWEVLYKVGRLPPVPPVPPVLWLQEARPPGWMLTAP